MFFIDSEIHNMKKEIVDGSPTLWAFDWDRTCTIGGEAPGKLVKEYGTIF